MGIFDRLFGSGKSGMTDEPISPLPWERKPSLYEFINDNIQRRATGLTERDEDLPDAERAFAGSEIRWVAGAMDGVAVYHMGVGADPEQSNKLLSLVCDYCKAPSVRNKLAVYKYVMQVHTLSIIDTFVEKLRQESRLNTNRLYELAKSFAIEATDREPVKWGVAILGIFGKADDKSLFRVLGRHDEFTLFAVVALSNGEGDVEQDIWELAKQVKGWGRIHAVEHLAKTEDATIKNWLLREGYKNWIMEEYLAYTCATAGGLLTALQTEQIDAELLEAAGDIIRALIAGGPANGMDEYDDGAMTVEYYLRHLVSQASSLSQFLTVDAIGCFLSEEDSDWVARASRGWTSERRATLSEQCCEIMQRPFWPDMIRAGLESPDEMNFFAANQAAAILKIDAWDYHWKRLRDKPLEPGRWYDAMQSCGQTHVGDVVAFAEQVLPLNEIATGPGKENGLGERFMTHSSLNFIVQDLGRFPGVGFSLIEVALKSPVISNRNMALKALEKWGKTIWPASTIPILHGALEIEPDEKVRESIQKVIDGIVLE